jgi:hypothetical protein
MSKATTLSQLELHALKSANYTDKKVAELGESVVKSLEEMSLTVTPTEITGGHRLTIKDAEGTKTVDVMDGTDGKAGTSVTVKSVTESNVSGGNNVVTFSDGKTLTVKNGKDGRDGNTGDIGQEGKSAYELWLDQGNTGTVADFFASLQGADGMTQVTPLYAESLEWLEENGEEGKLYVLPNGFIYAYFETESTILYTNRLPEADTDTLITGDLTTATKYTGYFGGVRLNSTGLLKAQAGYSATGFIPYTYLSADDYIKIKPFIPAANGTYNQELCFYDSSHKFLGYAGHSITDPEAALTAKDNGTIGWYMKKDSDGEYVLTWKPAETNAIKNGTVDTSKIAYIRIGAGDFANTIITINEDIVEGGSAGGLCWNNTGHAFIPANYESRILELEARMNNIAPKSGNIDLDYIRNWDAPIYDTNIPVFEITTQKAAIKDSERNPSSLYAKYDALMAQYPRYITKIDHGLCSDGVNHLYQYDFKTPTTDHTGSLFSEQKSKAILMSGIHQEPGGAYGLYYALEEMVSNPELRYFLNNVHLIVLPCANPYAFDTADISNVYLNANGVEIHRNFEVGFVVYESEGDDQYSGATPLTEIESQVIDNVLKTNQDAAFALSCHTFNNFSGKDVIWGSCGTKYTCNLVCRIIQKMSASFLDRFADEFTGIPSDNPTMGWVSISGTGGSEYRQATKYGIQGFNLEVSETFAPHDTTKRTAFAMTRYAEVYLNALLTAFGVYDYKDKDKYCKYIK